MPDKRLLYTTSRRLQAFRWKAGSLVAEGAYETGDEGASEFAQYVASSPESLYYFVADVIEEDFFQENIPYVRGRDRRTLLTRKLAHRYRDTTLTLALSLGTQQGERREERILFSSFTNTQQFQPWLAALKSNEARLVGVFSVALISPLLAKRIKVTAPRFVLVSLQEGGLRQSYVEEGQIRFSRLGRADPADPHATAEACASESAQIQQYLINLRILPREAGLLDVFVLAPAAQRELYQAAFSNNPSLSCHIIDLETASGTAGLKSAPEGMLGERLFLHVLAGAQPPEQFASDALRRFYYVWRARLALLTGGAAICALSLLISGLKFNDVYGINAAAETERRQEARLAQEYAKLQATFPKTPLSREDLKTAVGVFEALRRQTTLPDRLFAEISQALTATPQVELDKLDWEISSNPRERLAKDAPKADAGRGAPAAPAASAPTPAASRHFELVEISARINGVRSTDFRGTKAVADQFVEALRQRPGLEVIGVRLPFDLVADRALTGDVGEEPRNEAPRFSVTVSRKIGT